MADLKAMEIQPSLLLRPGSDSRPRVARTVTRVLGKPINRLLGLKELDALYCEAIHVHGAAKNGAAFLDRALDKLQVQTHLTPNLDGVPTEGPLVFVANHPYGGIEGLALVRELMRVRPDIKVLANRLLSRVVELDDVSIWVNPFGGEAAQKSNIGALREALRYVRKGGALLVFPAGEVSHLKARAKFDWSVLDPKWQASIARLIQAAKATVVPMYIEGRNSNLFQLAGLISPLLRTALLPRELLARRKSTLHARVGRAITPEQYERYAEPEKLIGFLRLATYALAGTRGASRPNGHDKAIDRNSANGASDANGMASAKGSSEAKSSSVTNGSGHANGSNKESQSSNANNANGSNHAHNANIKNGSNEASSHAKCMDRPSDSSDWSGANDKPDPNAAFADKRAPIAPAADRDLVAQEIARLEPRRKLHASGEFEVYCAYASEAPIVMHEIGRLREETFRAVGEGTGRALDLDAYDDDYRHLFLWHKGEQRIIGAYRLGTTDDIMAATGETGLYTRSLFRYSSRFIHDLGPAIELGRAFVARDFQRGYMPLMLLWQGIGRFLAKHPKYVAMFGPVSISADYSPVSRYVMARRLLSATKGRENASANKSRAHAVPQIAPMNLSRVADTEARGAFASQAEPAELGHSKFREAAKKLGASKLREAANRLRSSASRHDNPTGNFRVKKRGIAGVDLESLEALAANSNDLCNLISGIDPTGQGLPVLLRQYLKLNGRVLAFNLDADFGDSLDALLVVDLRDCEPKDLRRILGNEGFEAFTNLHGQPGLGADPTEPAEQVGNAAWGLAGFNNTSLPLVSKPGIKRA